MLATLTGRPRSLERLQRRSAPGGDALDTTDLDLFMFWNVRLRLDANKENRGPAFWMAGKVF